MKILVLGDFQGVFPEKLRKKLKKEELFDLIVGVGDYGGVDDWRPWIKEDFNRTKKGLPRINPEEFFGKRKFKKLVKKDIASTKNVFRKILNLNKKFIFVFGNGDDYWYNHPEWWKNESLVEQKKFIRKLGIFKDITYGKTSFRGIDFIGFGGYMDIEAFFNTKDLKYQTRKAVRERITRHSKMKRRFFKLLGKAYKNRKSRKILVLHYPPKGVFDIIKGGWEGNPMKGESSGIRFYTEAIKRYKPNLVLCGHMHEYQGMKKLFGVPVINSGDAQKGRYAIVEIDNKTGEVKARFIK